MTLEECLEGHKQTTTMKVMFGDTVISSMREIAIGPQKDVNVDAPSALCNSRIALIASFF